jgi:FixJ family two-component response regulator
MAWLAAVLELNPITAHEREVMRVFVSGMLTKQIASALGTSEITATVNRGQLMLKMHANSPPSPVDSCTQI